MLKIGLTGGIASGKSTVSQILRECGAVVIDADVIAREVVQPGSPGLQAIVSTFGPEILTAAGELDRAKLGSIVFAEPQQRKLLESITHPLVRDRMWAQVEEQRLLGLPAVVLDVPLLIEGGLHRQMDRVWVVRLDPEIQLVRLMKRDKIDQSAALARLAAQMPLAEKLRHASAVIDNGGDLAETRAQVQALWQSTLSASHAGFEPEPD